MRQSSLLIKLAAFTVLLLLAQVAMAQGAQEDSGALSQYVTGKITDEDALMSANPLQFPMYTLLILHEEESTSGVLDTDACTNGPCAICVSNPKGTDEDCFDAKCSSPDQRGMYQAISVPASGAFRRSGKGDLGVLFFSKRQTFGTGVEPFLAQVDPAVQACVCSELADEGFSPSLFADVPGLSACSTT